MSLGSSSIVLENIMPEKNFTTLKVGSKYKNKLGYEVNIDLMETDPEGNPIIFRGWRGSNPTWYLPNGKINQQVETDHDLMSEITYPKREPGLYWIDTDSQPSICEVYSDGESFMGVHLLGSDLLCKLTYDDEGINVARLGDRILPPPVKE